MKTALVFVLGLSGAGCHVSEAPVSGYRTDGLFVACTAQDDERYRCDPHAEETGTGEGTGTVEVDGDGCAGWVEGGAALVLWPPNHKLHTITLTDCAEVRSACPVAERAGLGDAGRIVAVTSDEPLEVGAGGDGHTETGDLVIVDARTVRLRSERQGGGDGRVYRIEFVDGAGGSDVCEVHVPHDRGPFGGAVAGAPVVRVTP